MPTSLVFDGWLLKQDSGKIGLQLTVLSTEWQWVKLKLRTPHCRPPVWGAEFAPPCVGYSHWRFDLTTFAGAAAGHVWSLARFDSCYIFTVANWCAIHRATPDFSLSMEYFKVHIPCFIIHSNSNEPQPKLTFVGQNWISYPQKGLVVIDKSPNGCHYKK